MNTDTLLELFQKGYRVTLGAASSAVEAVQDPQRAADEFSAVGTDFQQLADKLEVRGALTEKEARDFVEGVASQLPEPFRSVSTSFGQASNSPKTVTTVATPVVDASLQAEVESLTAELVAMRKEIDELKQKDS
ncbi:MAG: bZIP transcription factor [Phormidesmis priestleyi Ana]|uniref:BZIP transcription factor n=1 Tax=Phormidesmis priestleyi Ana TaxID=1666911 RepID=A0A0P8C4Y0_9CYAN|nr:MAG: bZIP transcription factor [Phormidesmis priestleyi Ana]